jgi:lysophospholipase L1-like esterase
MHNRTRDGIAYLAGVLNALCLLAILIGFAIWRVGLDPLGRLAREVIAPGAAGDRPDDLLPPMDAGLLDEVRRLGGVFDNAENPTGAAAHDNLLVRPHPTRSYVLRPNARVDAYMLATGQALNLDPPVLYMAPDAPMSVPLRAWVDTHSRLRYRFAVDERGFRRTLPVVRASRRVLMVGDSVLFGVGVDDRSTLASALQQLVGDTVEVTNAGVGGYGVEEIYGTAEELTAEQGYDALVYVACLNDFDDASPATYVGSATAMLERLAELAPRVEGRIAVLLQAHLQYTAWDVLQEAGWTPRENALADALRQGLPPVARRLGFAYLDFASRAALTSQAEGSLFHRFALYADQVHFSPLGNRLAAEQVHGALAGWGLGGR